jgi:hypothetical protein
MYFLGKLWAAVLLVPLHAAVPAGLTARPLYSSFLPLYSRPPWLTALGNWRKRYLVGGTGDTSREQIGDVDVPLG